MSKGSGTIYQRGDIWWVKLRVNGRAVYRSSKSTKKGDAIKLRDKLLAQRHRGEITGGAPDTVLIGELLDDLLKVRDYKPNTLYIWQKVIEKHIRPYFGATRAARLTTDMLERYREERLALGKTDTTANRELALLRMAFYRGKKRTPPKVMNVPYFPMVQETTIRKGFLSDEQYHLLLAELPSELKALFVTAYETGIRKGELLAITWPQVDFEAGIITLDKDETKNGEARSVPILDGDMHAHLSVAKQERDTLWPSSQWVFSRSGERIKDFRRGWADACQKAGLPELKFHDLRRTAVRNMRRAGVPQVMRMKISGHKTDSMERRYNITDSEDLMIAKELMERRKRNQNVTIRGNSGIPGDTGGPVE